MVSVQNLSQIPSQSKFFAVAQGDNTVEVFYKKLIDDIYFTPIYDTWISETLIYLAISKAVDDWRKNTLRNMYTKIDVFTKKFSLDSYKAALSDWPNIGKVLQYALKGQSMTMRRLAEIIYNGLERAQGQPHPDHPKAVAPETLQVFFNEPEKFLSATMMQNEN